MGKCILAGHTAGDTGGLRIATGNYVGTGTASVTLTFPFTPKLLVVANHNQAGCYATQTGENTNGGQGFVVIYGTTKYIVGQNNITATFPTALELTFTWDGESVSWKGSAQGWAANYNNNNYDWLIIG